MDHVDPALLSVVMPCHNAAPYVEEAIASVLGQRANYRTALDRLAAKTGRTTAIAFADWAKKASTTGGFYLVAAP